MSFSWFKLQKSNLSLNKHSYATASTSNADSQSVASSAVANHRLLMLNADCYATPPAASLSVSRRPFPSFLFLPLPQGTTDPRWVFCRRASSVGVASPLTTDRAPPPHLSSSAFPFPSHPISLSPLTPLPPPPTTPLPLFFSIYICGWRVKLDGGWEGD